MGMSAGYYLASQGVEVLLLDAFDPPHTFGSHHGDTRLLRHAYTGSRTYTEMALRADKLWTELEQAAGEPLIVRSGVLNIGTPDSSLLAAKLERSNEYGIELETLSSADMRNRWPGLTLPDSYTGIFEKRAGYLLSEACVSACRRLAEAQTAVVRPFTPLRRLEVERGDVRAHTDQGVFTAKAAVLSLGAWFGGMGRLPRLPIRAYRKAVAWFEPAERKDLFEASAFPGFTIDGPGGSYYGFPSHGGSGVKIGRHDGGTEWTPGEPFEPFGHEAGDERELRLALEFMMPSAAGRLLRGSVCKYEMTPDEDFIIDRHPDYEQVLLAGGFSGHGFKFASVVGEILSELIIRGETETDIRPFALSRFRQV